LIQKENSTNWTMSQAVISLNGLPYFLAPLMKNLESFFVCGFICEFYVGTDPAACQISTSTSM
jgi:hypothetical protein